MKLEKSKNMKVTLDPIDEDFGADNCEKKLMEAQGEDTETESHTNTEAQGNDLGLEVETNVLIKLLKKIKKKAIKKSLDESDVSAVSKTIRLLQKLSEPSVKCKGTFFPNFILSRNMSSFPSFRRHLEASSKHLMLSDVMTICNVSHMVVCCDAREKEW